MAARAIALCVVMLLACCTQAYNFKSMLHSRLKHNAGRLQRINLHNATGEIRAQMSILFDHADAILKCTTFDMPKPIPESSFNELGMTSLIDSLQESF